MFALIVAHLIRLNGGRGLMGRKRCAMRAAVSCPSVFETSNILIGVCSAMGEKGKEEATTQSSADVETLVDGKLKETEGWYLDF